MALKRTQEDDEAPSSARLEERNGRIDGSETDNGTAPSRGGSGMASGMGRGQRAGCVFSMSRKPWSVVSFLAEVE